MRRKSKHYNNLIDTIVCEDATIKGALHTQKSVRIEGRYEGEINASGDIYIGETSTVKGDIIAKNIIVSGEFIGTIEAVIGLHVQSTGKVYGNIKAEKLIIEEGGIYKGHVNMDSLTHDPQHPPHNQPPIAGE